MAVYDPLRWYLCLNFEASTKIYSCSRVGGKEVSYFLVQYFPDHVVYNIVQ